MRPGYIVIVTIIWALAACDSSSKTKEIADLPESMADAVREGDIGFCPSSGCESAGDCELSGPCVKQVSCSGGCCKYKFEKAGTACDLPCQTGGQCDDFGACVDGEPVVCPDEDGNPCTVAECDPKIGACFAVETPMPNGAPPFKTACWEGIVCTEGSPDTTNAVPTELQAECAAANDAIEALGCVDQVVCLDAAGECATLYKPAKTPCWVSAGSNDETCFGRSCDGSGTCQADGALDVTCSADSLPNECDEACAACTSLTCHWIDDPASPGSQTKQVPYCRPQALVAVPCSDANDCTTGDTCIYDSETQGPLGKETLGLCQPGDGKDKVTCLEELELPELPCLKKGISCTEDEGCVLDQQVADEWCYPPPSVCFDLDGTFCTHIDLKDGLWDEETGCHLELIDDSTCSDGNPCTDDECDPIDGCININNSATCDDGNLCTVGDQCSNGVCSPGQAALDCDDGEPCTVDSCDPIDGCQHTPNVGQPCDDGDPCTGDGQCNEGFCTGASPLDCDDNNLCTDDSCDAQLGCQNVPNSAACDDMDACTTNDVCAAGECAGQPLDNCCGNGLCEAGETCVCLDDCPDQGGCTSCGPVGSGSSGALGEVTLAGAVTINTDSGAVVAGGQTLFDGSEKGIELIAQVGNANGFGAPELRVYHFAGLTIASGAVVTVTGSHGLALLSQADLEVYGVVNASGAGGTAGSTNVGGLAGSGGPGGYTGGQWTSGIGCVAGNGAAAGPGAGQEGGCGSGGGKGGNGSSGGGGGGGGGGCGGTGGTGGGHATSGAGGSAGQVAVDGTMGLTPGIPGTKGLGCAGAQPGSASNTYGQADLTVLFGGTGGSGGGFGGFAGFGGWGVGDGGTGYGGAPGFSGGAGGGGGGGGALLLCAGGEVLVPASGKLEVKGGLGGSGGGSGISESGKMASFGDGAIGGGGGGGRSGGGGGGGGGAGGSLLLAGSKVSVFGHLDAGGGSGGSAGWSGAGGFGGLGKNGGAKGGKGGDGGKGGAGGKGGNGYIRLDGGTVIMQGSHVGELSQ